MYYLLRDCSMYSLSIHVLPPNHYKFTIFSRFYFEITILFRKSPSIYYQYEFTICFEILQWSHCLFREFTLNPLFFAKLIWINYLFRDFTGNSSSFWRLHYGYTNNFAISFRILYLFPEITTNPRNTKYFHSWFAK